MSDGKEGCYVKRVAERRHNLASQAVGLKGNLTPIGSTKASAQLIVATGWGALSRYCKLRLNKCSPCLIAFKKTVI